MEGEVKYNEGKEKEEEEEEEEEMEEKQFGINRDSPSMTLQLCLRAFINIITCMQSMIL